jgi:predicted enzyme related to lactoylglutathione lyase
VLVSDGHLPYPFGRETMGYEVADVGATLTKAKASGASVLVDAFKTDEREAAVVQFPGGYIAEIHSSAR